MRNIVGQPVSGTDYFLRKTITNNLRDNRYTFNSPILQLWWNKYIRD